MGISADATLICAAECPNLTFLSFSSNAVSWCSGVHTDVNSSPAALRGAFSQYRETSMEAIYRFLLPIITLLLRELKGKHAP